MMEMIASINPYWGKSFAEFFVLFFNRVGQLLQGKLALADAASDEIQMLVLLLVAISCAAVGSFLVLKRMTMLANALSHTILLGIVLAYILVFSFSSGVPGSEPTLTIEILLIASLITGLATTLLTQFMTKVMKLQEDASIGLVFTTLFAIGIVLVTVFTRNVHMGTEAIMGNVDALHIHDLKLISIVAVVDFLVLGVFFKEFKITAFDSSLANSLGVSTNVFNYVLMVLVAATSIGAFRAVGVLLVLSFLVGPVLTARLLTDNLKKMILLAIGIGSGCSIVAVALSRHLLSVHQMPLSTSGLVVVVLTLAYAAAVLFAPHKGVISRAFARQRLKKNCRLREVVAKPPFNAEQELRD
ncbi:MAG TPA: metal ABC transporter permease [Rhabdochlamydiaceae bacterium]|nr:metal ABC transporter permease [Rhabdochlamydiaceae bacterium]